MDNKDQSYMDIGFNKFMERLPTTYHASDVLNGITQQLFQDTTPNGIIFDPFSALDAQSAGTLLPPTTGDQVQGGVITSSNGNLTIDLTNGILNYNDGANNLVTIGGTNTNGVSDSVQINNSNGASILSS